jgi:hypothetical protein
MPAKASKQTKIKEFTIDDEFKNLLPPLSPEDFEQLEKSILRDGCRDFLVIWKEKNILIDGHHRLAICQKHDCRYGIEKIAFESREDVLICMMENQKSRRNMNNFQWAEVVLKCKDTIATAAKANQKAGGGSVRQKSDNPVVSLKKLAKLAGLSHDTMHKIEYILIHASKGRIDALRRGEAKVSVNSVYEELREQEYEEAEMDTNFTRRTKRAKKKASSVPMPEREPPQKEYEIEIDSVIEFLTEMEQRLSIEDTAIVYEEVGKWISKRKVDLVVELM